MKLSAAAKDGEILTLRTIGHAALAADNSVNGSAVSLRLIWMLTGDSRTDWPVAKIYTSSIDCYTGERLIIGQVAARKNGISRSPSLPTSCSANRSLDDWHNSELRMRALSWSSERADDRECGGVCANPRLGLLVFGEMIRQ
jgi:hypothetical protein